MKSLVLGNAAVDCPPGLADTFNICSALEISAETRFGTHAARNFASVTVVARDTMRALMKTSSETCPMSLAFRDLSEPFRVPTAWMKAWMFGDAETDSGDLEMIPNPLM